MKFLRWLLPLIPLVALGQEVGGYPNASTLTGPERLLADQSGITVNITPAQILTYIATPGNLFPTFVSSECLSNNGTELLWTACSNGGTPGGSTFEIQYNNSGSFGGIALGTSGYPLISDGSSGAPSFAQLNLAGGGVSGVLSVANGGNGTGSPLLTAGTGITISGSWPDYTISSSGSMSWPSSAGVANYSGSDSWGTSYAVGTASGDLVQLGSSGLPAVGGSSLTSLPTNTGLYPTFNQSTTGNAATATGLAGTPTLCPSGEAAQGVLASGNATGCFTPSGSGITVQTNGTANASQTTLNFLNGTNIIFSNPSGGEETAAVQEPLGNGGAPVTGTTYTVQATDCGTQLVLENSSGVAVSVPAATGSFAGCQIDFSVPSGEGTAVLTPASGTLGGNSTIPIAANGQCSINSADSQWNLPACAALVSGGGSSSEFLNVASNVVATGTTPATAVSFSAAANADYYVTCYLSYEVSAGTFEIEFTGPASPTSVNYWLADTGNSNKTAFSSLIGGMTATTQTPINVLILNLQNGSTAGTVALEFINGTSTDTSTVFAGSYCRVN